MTVGEPRHLERLIIGDMMGAPLPGRGAKNAPDELIGARLQDLDDGPVRRGADQERPVIAIDELDIEGLDHRLGGMWLIPRPVRRAVATSTRLKPIRAAKA